MRRFSPYRFSGSFQTTSPNGNHSFSLLPTHPPLSITLIAFNIVQCSIGNKKRLPQPLIMVTSLLLSVSSCAWKNITLLFWPVVPPSPFSQGIGNWRVQLLLSYQLLIELPAVKKMAPVFCSFFFPPPCLADMVAWSEPRKFLGSSCSVNNLFL